jgi:hypothetical protein
MVTGGERVNTVLEAIVEVVALSPPGDAVALNADSVEGSLTDTIREPMTCTCSVRFP